MRRLCALEIVPLRICIPFDQQEIALWGRPVARRIIHCLLIYFRGSCPWWPRSVFSLCLHWPLSSGRVLSRFLLWMTNLKTKTRVKQSQSKRLTHYHKMHSRFCIEKSKGTIFFIILNIFYEYFMYSRDCSSVAEKCIRSCFCPYFPCKYQQFSLMNMYVCI